MTERVKTGAVQGRFQGLHMGHMEFLMEAKKRCDFLIIGITNYDIRSEHITSDAKQHRLRTECNPFTYYDRMMMIRSSMEEIGTPLSEFCVTPFPIETPDKLFNFVPADVVFFQTIYDQWGEEKLQRLQELGYRTRVMWRRNESQRVASGTLIRDLIRSGGEWQRYMPKAAREYIIQNGLDQKLQRQQV